jgi:pantetheine-phosphate adenylyltransferase
MPHPNIITGSFDPPTIGHLSIIERATKLLGHITVVVCTNAEKHHMFEPEDRVAMVAEMVKHLPKVSVMELYDGEMISSFIQQHKVKVLIRGLRNGLDLEYERAIEQFVREYGNVEVVYLLNEPALSTISSSITRNHLIAMSKAMCFDLFIFKYLTREVVDVISKLPWADGIINRKTIALTR